MEIVISLEVTTEKFSLPGIDEFSELQQAAQADHISRSVLAGVGRYLQLVKSQQQDEAPAIEPTRLAYFPIFQEPSDMTTQYNDLMQSGRAEFIRRATASSKAELFDYVVETDVPPDLPNQEIRAISSLLNCLLVEQRHLDRDGVPTGYTYWAEPSTILDRLVEEALTSFDLQLIDTH